VCVLFEKAMIPKKEKSKKKSVGGEHSARHGSRL
jgi:hypothetical protein